jgi:hypothetical protein
VCVCVCVCVCVVKPILAILVPFKAAQIIQVANLWKAVNPVKIELRTVTCASVQFRVQRHVVLLESRYTTPSVNRALNYSTRSVVEKEWILSGQKVVLQSNGGRRPTYRATQKLYNFLFRPKLGRLNLYIRHNTKCEIVAKVQDRIRRWSSY